MWIGRALKCDRKDIKRVVYDKDGHTTWGKASCSLKVLVDNFPGL